MTKPRQPLVSMDDQAARLEAAETLLAEWVRWWRFDDAAPAKLPHALHVRSELHLQLAERARDTGEHD